MQKELAGFLKRCPGGVVALDNAQKLHPALLPVFINALSEQGSFEVPPLPCLGLFSLYACAGLHPAAVRLTSGISGA